MAKKNKTKPPIRQKNKPAFEQALATLREGNKRFAEGLSGVELAHGTVGVQTSIAAVLCCAEGRICPEAIFDVHPGDLFVIRVPGNVVDPTSVAGIEYAVAHLNVKLILVMGHTGCGIVRFGLSGLEDAQDNGDNLNSLLTYFVPSVAAAKSQKSKFKNDPLAVTIETHVQSSVSLLRRRSQILSESDVGIVPAIYDDASGKVAFL